MRIIIFGSINIDLSGRMARLPRPGETLHGETFSTELGGKGANQAVAVARLGARAALVARVGTDAFGSLAIDRLAALGVDTAALTIDPAAPTGIAMIQVDALGANTIAVFAGANARLGLDDDLARAALALRGASVLLLQLEVPLAANLAIARLARSAGVTVVLDPAPCPDSGLPDELLQAADIITPNEVEAEALTGIACTSADAARRAAQQLVALGAGLAIVKLGGRGAYLSGRGFDAVVPAFSVRAIDTVAAGDCFNGGLAVALAEGLALPAALRWACACGALATTRSGAAEAMPTRAEVLALLAAASG